MGARLYRKCCVPALTGAALPGRSCTAPKTTVSNDGRMAVPATDLSAKIPNNVGLGDDPRVRRALEHWQPRYVDWWRSAGPESFETQDVWLRTAVGVGAKGWANWGYVKMPEYRWGIFLAPPKRDAAIPAGDDAGRPMWNQVPGEFRAPLRRIITTQGDTEPASVEQQRKLGATAPSLYDLRNLFQVNVEEGRHLWAMVYLLHKYFGADGRDEADELLERRAGDADKPRILTTFNSPCDDWLSFFCFTAFTDRDGKYQLGALAQSAFEPLARSCDFMLTEEAFHLFVGETGIERIILRAAELEALDPNGDVRAQGGIDFDTIQRSINYWFSNCMDLFGGEISNNAADYFGAGLKGRFREAERYTEHGANEEWYQVPVVEDGQLTTREVPLRSAMNEVLRDDYAADCERVVARWNKKLHAMGNSRVFTLPHKRFNRHQGLYRNLKFNPAGELIDDAQWERGRDTWLSTAEDRAYIQSISRRVTKPGEFANWIKPPTKGNGGQAVDFEYVRA